MERREAIVAILRCLRRHGGISAVCCARSVCREWREAADCDPTLWHSVAIHGASRLVAFLTSPVAKHPRMVRVYGSNVENADLAAVTTHLADTLESLDVEDCPRLTGAGLTAAVSRCSQLMQLRAARVHSFGDDPVLSIATSLRSLHKLDLSHTSISDAGLAILARSSCGQQLEQLNIAFCVHIGDSGLRILSALCVSLLDLRAEMCPRIGEDGIRALAGMSALTRLHIGSLGPHPLPYTGLTALGCAANPARLRHLRVVHADDACAYALASGPAFSRLAVLDLHAARIGDAAALRLARGGVEAGALHSLEELSLSFCRPLGGEAAGALASGAKALRKLSLSCCAGIDEDTLATAAKFLAQRGCLRELSIDCCPGVKDTSVKLLAPVLSALRSLTLSSPSFSEECVGVVAKHAKSLTRLELSRFQVTATAMPALLELPSTLRHLSCPSLRAVPGASEALENRIPGLDVCFDDFSRPDMF